MSGIKIYYNVARVYALFILDCPSVLSNVYWNRDGQQFQQYQQNEQISPEHKKKPHYVYAYRFIIQMYTFYMCV
jgi:hypothetical protein